MKSSKLIRRQAGFTAVELLIVIGFLGACCLGVTGLYVAFHFISAAW